MNSGLRPNRLRESRRRAAKKRVWDNQIYTIVWVKTLFWLAGRCALNLFNAHVVRLKLNRRSKFIRYPACNHSNNKEHHFLTGGDVSANRLSDEVLRTSNLFYRVKINVTSLMFLFPLIKPVNREDERQINMVEKTLHTSMIHSSLYYPQKGLEGKRGAFGSYK